MESTRAGMSRGMVGGFGELVGWGIRVPDGRGQRSSELATVTGRHGSEHRFVRLAWGIPLATRFDNSNKTLTYRP
jgi:hypothetical protein